MQAQELGWLPGDHRLAILQYAFWETDSSWFLRSKRLRESLALPHYLPQESRQNPA